MQGKSPRDANLPGVLAALQADPDDYHGRASLAALPLMLGWGAGLRIAAAARDRDCRRVDRVASAHAVHHAGDLSRFDSLARRARARFYRNAPPRPATPVSDQSSKRMNLSATVHRAPVATTLLAIGIALAGLFAFTNACRLRRLPQVDFPTISVQASLPGASPETVATIVASPLERHLGSIADVTEMTSQSRSLGAGITLQFGLKSRHRRRRARRAGGNQCVARRSSHSAQKQSDLPQGQSRRRRQS